MAGELARFADAWKPLEAAATKIATQEKSLLAFGTLLAAVNDATPRLTALAEEVTQLRLQQGASAREVGLAGQLATAAHRLARNVNVIPAGRSDGAEAAQAVSRDLGQLRDLLQTLLVNAEGEARNRLQQIVKISGDLQVAAGIGLPAAGAAAEAAAARNTLQGSAEAARQQLAAIQGLFTREKGVRAVNLAAAAVFALLTLGAVFVLMQVLLRDSRRRALEADVQRMEAQRLEQAAKRPTNRTRRRSCA
jgi:twitching motility protein PilJ